MSYSLLTGRILFSLIFISSGLFHFSKEAVEYAALHQVPMAEILVPIAGIMAILGGLSVAFGYKAKTGAWLLVIFLVPVTFYMHNFWSGENSLPVQTQMAAFMKNFALIGTALFIAHFGSGSLSLDSVLKMHILKCKKARAV
jgi:putative oxidoreductase